MGMFENVAGIQRAWRLLKIGSFVFAAWLCGLGEKVNPLGSPGLAMAATTPPIALLQQAELSVGAGASSISHAFPGPSNSGDLIVATVKWGGQNLAVASITDNKGNLY